MAMAMAPTTTAQTKGTMLAALDAARGASLAAHSSAGLALPVSREAARLLRTAEGLCRAAAAILRTTSLQLPPAEAAPAAPRPRRRPRGSRGRKKRTEPALQDAPGGQKEDVDMEAVQALAAQPRRTRGRPGSSQAPADALRDTVMEVPEPQLEEEVKEPSEAAWYRRYVPPPRLPPAEEGGRTEKPGKKPLNPCMYYLILNI